MTLQAESRSKPITEEWRPVPGYRGYHVSNWGRVKGRRGTILSPKADRKQGYLLVWIKDDFDVARTRKIHHLVLEAFVGPRPDGLETCHNDGVPANNWLTNLRWDTKPNNAKDRRVHGTDFQANKVTCSRGHEFREGNLVSRPGNHRSCLACHNTRSKLYGQDYTEEEFQATADVYYESSLNKFK